MSGEEPPLRHWNNVDVLFLDFDGVIIDSEYVHYRVWRDEFRERGLLLSTDAWAGHWAANRSVPGDLSRKPPVSALLEQRLGRSLPDGEDVTRRVRARYHEEVGALPVRPGIEGWLREAAADRVRCVVVTDNKADRVRDALTRLDLMPLIEAVVGRHPDRARKPAPDAYLAALAQVRVGPDQAVAAEDSPQGIAAARAAGLRCLAVPHKITSHLLVPGPGVVIVEPGSVSLDRALSMLARQAAGSPPRRGDETRAADRIRGSIAGLAVGDATGKLIDKRPEHQLEAESVAMLDALAAGGDPPAVFGGRITDDTVLALALAATIIATGTVSREALEAKLRIINPHGGRQVYKLKAAAGPLYVAADGATNGCVPRSAAVGFIYQPHELGDICYDTLKTVTLTHGHPDAVMAALAFTMLISHAVAGDSPQDALAALRPAVSALGRVAGGGTEVGKAIVEHTAAARRFARLDKYVDYLEDTVGMAVAARSSAVAGICLGLSGYPYRQLMSVLLRRRARWDLDSVAAISGALVGAFNPDTVPWSWAAATERFAASSFSQIAEELGQVRRRRQPP
ncbi:MAG TPA: HAD-IA family hydrolase [Streptosporangiaceae bacterium]|nr:HAD-IA family hydrolase [Streptosporangiaceae bacterium]HUZ27576.1 HAD-IA family hydrolase [Streptosporangiaceae bacterium]